MVPIFICENDLAQREKIENIVKKYIMIENYDMKMVLSTDSPCELLAFLKKEKITKGVYFLDIDLSQDTNGIQLGAEIRKIDIYGRIIFVTAHNELMPLTFTYKVEAMDYIVKDGLETTQKKIQDCLKQINDYYTSETTKEEDRIKLRINNQIRVFDLKDILFFETIQSSHKIALHLTTGRIEFYGELSAIEELSSLFIRVHKSYLINERNIVTIDKKKREVVMRNGEIALVSIRKMKLLKGQVIK